MCHLLAYKGPLHGIRCRIQAIGISIWATARSSEDGSSHDVKLGGTIIVVGLGLQLVSFLIFILVAVWVRRHPK